KKRCTLVRKSASAPRSCVRATLSLTRCTGMSNTSDFILNKEDHTRGNLLSEHLKLHPNVYTAGDKRALPLPCRRASFSYLVLTADLRRPQSATPTYHSCSSGCRPTAPRRRARSFAPCARSSSTC